MSLLKRFGGWIASKVESALDWLNDKLSGKKYDESSLDDQVDVDALLAEHRYKIKGDVAKAEKDCMDSMNKLFSELTRKTKNKFPDLAEIIQNEQRRAERDLDGTVIDYVREHLSKNDPQFLQVLKMNSGQAKKDQLDMVTNKILLDAEKDFYKKLSEYAEHLLEEFTSRLNSRIEAQEQQMNQRITELEEMQKKAEAGKLDIEVLKEKSIPYMESAECIIQILEMEM